jgi:hypothetical protein
MELRVIETQEGCKRPQKQLESERSHTLSPVYAFASSYKPSFSSFTPFLLLE